MLFLTPTNFLPDFCKTLFIDKISVENAYAKTTFERDWQTYGSFHMSSYDFYRKKFQDMDNKK